MSAKIKKKLYQVNSYSTEKTEADAKELYQICVFICSLNIYLIFSCRWWPKNAMRYSFRYWFTIFPLKYISCKGGVKRICTSNMAGCFFYYGKETRPRANYTTWKTATLTKIKGRCYLISYLFIESWSDNMFFSFFVYLILGIRSNFSFFFSSQIWVKAFVTSPCTCCRGGSKESWVS